MPFLDQKYIIQTIFTLSSKLKALSYETKNGTRTKIVTKNILPKKGLYCRFAEDFKQKIERNLSKNEAK
jgi:hypothetical protein